MKKIGSFLLSAWVISGIAVAVLCLLVWFFGPILGSGVVFPLEPVLPRATLIGVIALVWLVLNWRRTSKARARERNMVASLAGPAAPDQDQLASAEELALLPARGCATRW